MKNYASVEELQKALISREITKKEFDSEIERIRSAAKTGAAPATTFTPDPKPGGKKEKPSAKDTVEEKVAKRNAAIEAAASKEKEVKVTKAAEKAAAKAAAKEEKEKARAEKAAAKVKTPKEPSGIIFDIYSIIAKTTKPITPAEVVEQIVVLHPEGAQQSLAGTVSTTLNQLGKMATVQEKLGVVFMKSAEGYFVRKQ